MFQACVSISVCIFYVFINIYTGYVCINGHTAGLRYKNKIYRPTYFSVARYANTTKQILGLSGVSKQNKNCNLCCYIVGFYIVL